MARASWTSLVAQNDTTQFRAWGSEFKAKLVAMGLTQTADTGQIDWTTVNRPATANTDAGYEVWRFNDSLQATAPIYFKIVYGTSGIDATRPRIDIQFGTGSNGSGTLTGLTSTSRGVSTVNGTQSDTVGRQSFMSYKPERGFFGFTWKVGAGCQGEFFIARTVDASGDPTDVGALVAWSSGNGQQFFRFASPASAFTFVSGCQSCLIPQNVTNSIVTTGEPQVYTHYVSDPRVNPINQVLTVFEQEFGQGTTFTATVLGATPRTYIVPQGPMPADSQKGTSAVAIAYIWET